MRKFFLESGRHAGAQLPVHCFDIFQKFSGRVAHGVFTREGGVSDPPFDSLNVRFGIGDPAENVRKNRAQICAALGIKSANLISANQTHSKKVRMVDQEFLQSRLEREIDGVDAFVTAMNGAALMIQVADCQAILMFDPVRGVIAAVHAGWKGLAQDISGETLRVMGERFGTDPADVICGIAPSLGPCCAYFSDPLNELPGEFHAFVDEQKRADLWSFSVMQLRTHGIREENIELSRVCTQCGGAGTAPGGGGRAGGGGRFFSYRGEKGVTGRFGVVIMLRASAR